MKAKVEVKRKYPTKGRKKGNAQKMRECSHCGTFQAANMKICCNCLKLTGFWSK